MRLPDENEDRAGETEAPRGGGATLVLFALGFLAFELTANPALGVIIACLKFGLEDWRTALWLRQVDPVRSRGKTCFWMFVASGCWKTAGLALLASVGAVAVGAALAGEAAMKALEPQLWGLACVILGGLSLLFAASVVALFSAWRTGTRLWVSRGVHRARREEVWPPWRAFRSQRDSLNRAGDLMMPMLILSCLGSTVTLILAMVTLLPRNLLERHGGAIGAGFGIGAPIMVAVIVLMLRDLGCHRLVALSPADCWPLVDREPSADPWRTGRDSWDRERFDPGA